MFSTGWLCVFGAALAFALPQTEQDATSNTEIPSQEDEARIFLKELNESGLLECNKATSARWNYRTNITEQTKKLQASAQLEYAAWNKKYWSKVNEFKGWKNLTDPFLRRQFKAMSVLGTAALPSNELEEYNSLITNMSTIYGTAKICDYNNSDSCNLALNPELQEILRTSNDYDELEHVWKKWRDATGRHMREQYKQFVSLANKAAQLNDFGNLGDMWLEAYETDTFRDDLALLWNQLQPLYQQLHAYVRRKLREQYGEQKVTRRGPIPAHLLGNMWAQQWGNIYKFAIPYPNKTFVDVTPQMVEQGYTPKRMFEMSEDFFTSLNLTKMPNEFWNNSIIERPKGREVVCHASAWDFCNGKDFRIMQCTKVTMKDLITVHHEMGHIQYSLQYKHLPYVFRIGANPGFHEAVGDVLALSVATPKHLAKVGLLKQVQDDYESEINFLMNMALEKITFLPFGYLMDLWRWDVFSNKTTEDNWNCAWWDLRYRLQGIKPPVVRSENDFDPGAKFHITANVPYIRYFVSFVIQFQFHKALCEKAGEYNSSDPLKPLHKCDIYQSSQAGNALGDMLQLGASLEWPEAMAALTGDNKMDGSVIREYFKPLETWLQNDNKKHGEFIGWESDEIICTKNTAVDSTTNRGTVEPHVADTIYSDSCF